MAFRWKATLASALLLAACGGDGGAELRIDLRTDCAPGDDFDTIELLVTRASTGDLLSERTIPASPEGYLDGRRVTEVDGLPSAELRVRLRLRLDAVTISERSVLVNASGVTPLTVVVTCGPTTDMGAGDMSVCDADGDGAEATSCGGPDCNDTSPEVGPGQPERGPDGVDDDCDGAVDEGLECTSGDERGALCSDGCDNDDDGEVDCEDTRCFGAPGCDCTPSASENTDEECSDGCDNDGNGFVDCEDFGCDGRGGCPSGCGCEPGEECLHRPEYGIETDCGDPCTVGSDAGASPSSWLTSTGGCDRGDVCWWRGDPSTPDGVCAPPTSTSPTGDVGSPCASDSDCVSPFGFGRCLTEAADGFTDGTCTIVDCHAPGLPADGAVCGSDAGCFTLTGEAAYCLSACTADTDCRSGYRCVSTPGSPGDGACLPSCPGSGSTCGSNRWACFEEPGGGSSGPVCLPGVTF